MRNIFFDNWDSIIRTIVIAVLAYIAILFLLRTSGKRTLTKMNAFDFVVTIALGSTLATVILNKDITLSSGVLAFFLLISFQYIITFFSARSGTVSQLVKGSPALLVYKGRMLREKMKQERIDEDEIYSSLRKNGISSVEEADAVVLETDGTISVMKAVGSFDDPVFMNMDKPSTANV